MKTIRPVNLLKYRITIVIAGLLSFSSTMAQDKQPFMEVAVASFYNLTYYSPNTSSNFQVKCKEVQLGFLLQKKIVKPVTLNLYLLPSYRFAQRRQFPSPFIPSTISVPEYRFTADAAKAYFEEKFFLDTRITLSVRVVDYIGFDVGIGQRAFTYEPTFSFNPYKSELGLLGGLTLKISNGISSTIHYNRMMNSKNKTAYYFDNHSYSIKSNYISIGLNCRLSKF